jgi:hypothetical protein
MSFAPMSRNYAKSLGKRGVARELRVDAVRGVCSDVAPTLSFSPAILEDARSTRGMIDEAKVAVMAR